MKSLFVDLLGESQFAMLPPRVQALHRTVGTRDYRGQARVVRGRNVLARLCGVITSQPPAAQEVALCVEIATTAQGECWTRDFAGHRMRSTMWACDGLLCERLGLVTFGFALMIQDAALVWRVRRVSVLGLRLPPGWFDGVHARESEVDGRYHFDVVARLPMVGLLVHYRGWLNVE